FISDSGAFTDGPASERVLKVFGVAAPGLLAGQPFPSTARSTFPIPGDLNSDGGVDIQDVTLSLRLALGISPASAIQKAVGDASGDGLLGLKDTTLLLRKSLGM